MKRVFRTVAGSTAPGDAADGRANIGYVSLCKPPFNWSAIVAAACIDHRHFTCAGIQIVILTMFLSLSLSLFFLPLLSPSSLPPLLTKIVTSRVRRRCRCRIAS